MIEERSANLPGQSGTPTTGADEMAQALESVKASSPELAEAIAASGLTPDELAQARTQAAAGEPPNLGEGQG